MSPFPGSAASGSERFSENRETRFRQGTATRNSGAAAGSTGTADRSDRPRIV